MHTHWDKSINILSWNVNGLGDKVKRSIVLQYIKKQGPDVVLLQETHLMGFSCRAMNRSGYKLVVHAGFTAGSRGVGIMVKNTFPLSVDSTGLMTGVNM